jgi:hypothetical protein
MLGQSDAAAYRIGEPQSVAVFRLEVIGDDIGVCAIGSVKHPHRAKAVPSCDKRRVFLA